MISSRKLRKLKKFRKVLLLLMLVVVTTTVLVVETYAWYAGFGTSSTNTFNVAISSSNGLELSLDGSTWSTTTLSLTKSDVLNAYTGNSNVWADYFSPVSTIGEMDTTTSRLKLFQADSLSASAGGYRIVGSQFDNSTTEGNGYIAFDLFIRNGKGTSYSSSYDQSSEEEVFLSGGASAVTEVTGTTPNYGAANSLRVGFFEIGRMKASGYNADTLRGITCAGGTNITSLCSTSSDMKSTQFYKWNIWEPNYASHATNLVNYYNTACKKRGSSGNYYSNSCIKLDEGFSKPTYAMKTNITVDNAVDIYDGVELNSYSRSSYLSTMKTYKTTDATTIGTNKRALIRLAGNSVTKIRVYIWLEGQDIDNYDVITKNPTMSINFGFTKDKLGVDTANNSAINNRTSTFQDDSWKQIQYNVQHGNTSQYRLGDERELVIGSAIYRLRLVNKTFTASCSELASQTACGFVIEFVDAIDKRPMKNSELSIGGFQNTYIYSILNYTLLDNIPKDLKDVIIDTKVVTSHNSSESSNFTYIGQKFFLASPREYFGDGSSIMPIQYSDSSYDTTRQLDYYNGKVYIDDNSPQYFHAPTSDYLTKYAIAGSEVADGYWLRNPLSVTDSDYFIVKENRLYADAPNKYYYIYPLFRIG